MPHSTNPKFTTRSKGATRARAGNTVRNQPRHATHATIPRVARFARVPSTLAVSNESPPSALEAAISSTHRKSVYASTRSPGLNTRPYPCTRFSAYLKLIRASSITNGLTTQVAQKKPARTRSTAKPPASHARYRLWTPRKGVRFIVVETATKAPDLPDEGCLVEVAVYITRSARMDATTLLSRHHSRILALDNQVPVLVVDGVHKVIGALLAHRLVQLPLFWEATLQASVGQPLRSKVHKVGPPAQHISWVVTHLLVVPDHAVSLINSGGAVGHERHVLVEQAGVVNGEQPRIVGHCACVLQFQCRAWPSMVAQVLTEGTITPYHIRRWRNLPLVAIEVVDRKCYQPNANHREAEG